MNADLTGGMSTASTLDRLMAACDLSHHGVDALLYGIKLSLRLEAELVVLNVIHQQDVDAVMRVRMVADQAPGDQYIGEMKQYRRSEMQKIIDAAGAPPGLCRMVFRVGVPYREILNAAEEEGVSLLVIGAKGHRDADRLLYGPTAEKLIRNCTIPLLMIPGPERRRGNGRETGAAAIDDGDGR